MQAVLFVALCLGLAMSGCTAPPTAGTDNQTSHPHAMDSHSPYESDHAMHTGMVHVTLLDGRYEPSQVNASVDGGVHFTNEGQQEHTVSIVDETATFVFDQALKPGQAAHFQPPAPGAYHVLCRLHEGMDADIHVA